MTRSYKAQTATEYMVVLAVVIIIALILVAVLGQFPGMGGNARGRGSSAFWSTATIGFMSYAIADDGDNDDVTLRVRNNLKDTITINSISFDGTEIYAIDTVIAVGQTKTINIDDAGEYCSMPGDSYTIEVNVTYTDDENGETFSYTGGGNKLEGICAI